MADRRSKVVLGLFLVSAVVVLALSLYTGFALNSLVNSLEESRNQRLLAEAQAASLIVSAEELDAIQRADDLDSETADALERRLSAFASLHNLTQITFMRQLPSGELQYIVCSNQGTGTYDISASSTANNDMIKKSLEGSLVVSDMDDEGAADGELMAYSPVFDANGTVVAIAAVGIDDTAVIATDLTIRNLTVILLICIAIVILAACANVLLQVKKEHELQESVRVQKLMIEISQHLASEQPFDERLLTTLDILGTYLDAQRVYIANLSEEEVENSLRQYWSYDNTNPVDEIQNATTVLDLLRTTFDAKDTNKQATMHSHNVKQTHEGHFSNLHEAGTASFIWAPLIVQQEIWGVLALDFSRSQAQFHDKDIQLVESAASDLVGAITRELYNEQREHALDHAVHASEVKGEFLSNMSHEMRTPMNAIIGMTSIALGSNEIERKDYCLEHIKDASAHLLTIINDVLDMSSLQSNELSLTYKPFDLRHTLGSLERDYLHKIEEHNLSFTLEIDHQIPSTLMGDRQRLAQVVDNLLSNATKFTPDGGTVALRVLHQGSAERTHTVRFEIEDSGIGIDSAMRDNLFGSFEQADSGSNRKYGGTGLGLAISRRLVELMGGQIGFEPKQPQGSLFYFTVGLEENDIPLAEQTSLNLNGKSAAQPSIGTSGAQSVLPQAATLLQEATSQAKIAPSHKETLLQDAEAHDDAASAPEESPVAVNEDGTPDFSDYRILLAEDIAINREVVLALLADSGVAIEVTTNGIEVLEAVKQDPTAYDLVFMDLQMPEMDGLDATRRIRALDHEGVSSLPIIAMTANVSQEDIDACLDAGMNDHIGKPLDLDEIYRILKHYLPKKHS